jgi:hypothetical protein
MTILVKCETTICHEKFSMVVNFTHTCKFDVYVIKISKDEVTWGGKKIADNYWRSS